MSARSLSTPFALCPNTVLAMLPDAAAQFVHLYTAKPEYFLRRKGVPRFAMAKGKAEQRKG